MSANRDVDDAKIELIIEGTMNVKIVNLYI